jgi:hypothetical protein
MLLFAIVRLLEWLNHSWVSVYDNIVYNSRVDAIGFIRREEDEINYITLNLIANL